MWRHTNVQFFGKSSCKPGGIIARLVSSCNFLYRLYRLHARRLLWKRCWKICIISFLFFFHEHSRKFCVFRRIPRLVSLFCKTFWIHYPLWLSILKRGDLTPETTQLSADVAGNNTDMRLSKKYIQAIGISHSEIESNYMTGCHEHLPHSLKQVLIYAF